MTEIDFKRIAPDESRVYFDGDLVGEVYGLDDPCRPGARYYVIHLIEDPRGPLRVHDRARIREVARARVASHPLW